MIAYDVEPDNRCGGYSWEVSGDGGVQPYVLRDCQVNGLRLPVYSTDPLLVTQARTQPAIGFDAPDCGAAGNWRTGCKLFFMFDVTGRKLSDSGIYGVVTQQAFWFLAGAARAWRAVRARELQRAVRPVHRHRHPPHAAQLGPR